MDEPLHHLPGLRFDCTRCGQCCQQWGVEVSLTEKQRLETLDWKLAPNTPPRDAFFRQVGTRWLLGLQPSGVCRFLGSDNLCIIHKHFGAHAKPAACQRFPYHFVRTPTGVFTSLSYVSAGARNNHGRELLQYSDELAALYARLGPDREHGATIALTDNKQATWQEYLAWEEQIRAQMAAAPPGQLWRCLLAGEQSLTQQAATEEPLAITALNWRQRAILGLCVQAFLHGTQHSATTPNATTLIEAILPPVLRWQLRWNERTLALADLARLPNIPLDADAETMLQRFLVQTLFGKCYFGRWGDEHISVLAGFRFLMLQYVLILFSAKLGNSVSEAVMTTSRNLQHRAAMGSWVLPAERLAAEMRSLVPRLLPPAPLP